MHKTIGPNWDIIEAHHLEATCHEFFFLQINDFPVISDSAFLPGLAMSSFPHLVPQEIPSPATHSLITPTVYYISPRSSLPHCLVCTAKLSSVLLIFARLSALPFFLTLRFLPAPSLDLFDLTKWSTSVDPACSWLKETEHLVYSVEFPVNIT